MFFTPNIAAKLEDYVAYMPDDLSTVHLIGYVSIILCLALLTEFVMLS